MKTNISSKQITKAFGSLTLIASLLFSQASFAGLVLDLNSKGGKSLYNVEVNKDSGSYSVTVKKMKDGESVVVYTADTINMVPRQDGQIEYKDSRFKLVDRKDGTAQLVLSNGENIQVELSE